jgi:hypothetical protein
MEGKRKESEVEERVEEEETVKKKKKQKLQTGYSVLAACYC